MRRNIRHTKPKKTIEIINNRYCFTDIEGQKWIGVDRLRSANVNEILFSEYWPETITTPDGKKWHFLENGSYNVAYRCGDEVYKIQRFPEDNSDAPERSVKLWNEINNPDNDPRLAAKRYESGWTAPFIEGTSPTPEEIAETMVDIYARTRRFVADPLSRKEDKNNIIFRNFIKTPSGKTVCIDIGAALRFEKRLERSEISHEHWNNYRDEFTDLLRHNPQNNPSISALQKVAKALLYVEIYNLELANIELLKTDMRLVDMLATAYDQRKHDIQIDPSYLLSTDQMLYQTRANNFEDPRRFTFVQKKYYAFTQLIEMGVSENAARVMARDPALTPEKIEALKHQSHLFLSLTDIKNHTINEITDYIKEMAPRSTKNPSLFEPDDKTREATTLIANIKACRTSVHLFQLLLTESQNNTSTYKSCGQYFADIMREIKKRITVNELKTLILSNTNDACIHNNISACQSFGEIRTALAIVESRGEHPSLVCLVLKIATSNNKAPQMPCLR